MSAAGAAGASPGGSSGAGGAACTPTNGGIEICDDLDNNCDGRIDNVDKDFDGICDCLRIGIVGVPGANASSNFQAWLQARGTTVSRVNQTATETFDAALLANFDIALFDELVRPYTTTEASALETWVTSGGGFVTMTGYIGSPNPDFYPNAILAPFGFNYVPPLISGPVTAFLPHPTTMGLSSVTFSGGYAIQSTTPAGSTSVAVATLPGGTVAYAHQHGMGRGFIWGDEWIEFDSEWTTMPEIQKMWVNVIGWVGPQNRCVVDKP